MKKVVGKQKTTRPNYRRNQGKAGVVYVLLNDGLREGWLKIGCSTRSGTARARELNDDANTGTPGVFRCVFECKTVDCGRAEELVFAALADHRRGKWGQEYFVVEIPAAKTVISQVCADLNKLAEPPPQITPPRANTPPPVAVSPAPAPTNRPEIIANATLAMRPNENTRNFLCDKCRRVVNLNQPIDCPRAICVAKNILREVLRSEAYRTH